MKRDQETISQAVRNGFDDRGAVIEWAVKANVRTLGILSESFYTGFMQRLDLRWLLEDADSRTPALSYREDLSIRLDAAAAKAYRLFRDYAAEHPDKERPTIQLNGSGTVGFRPALTEAEERQAAALEEARTGFSSRYALADWEREFQAATFGEFDRRPEYPISRSRGSDAYSLLVSQPGETRAVRDIWVMNHLFPACIAGISELRAHAEEELANEAVDAEPLEA